MKQALAVLLASVALLLWSGCSGEDPVSPVSNRTTAGGFAKKGPVTSTTQAPSLSTHDSRDDRGRNSGSCDGHEGSGDAHHESDDNGHDGDRHHDGGDDSCDDGKDHHADDRHDDGDDGSNCGGGGSLTGCDVQTDRWAVVALVSAVINTDGSQTYTYAVQNNDRHGLSHVAFELPLGCRALGLGSTYRSVTGRTYTVENTTNNPFYSLKFNASCEGIKSGQSDRFTFTLPAVCVPLAVQRVVVKAATVSCQVTMHPTGCLPLQPVCPVFGSLDVSSTFPGGTITISGSNFGATQGTSVVTIGGVPAAIQSWSQGQIVATAPTVTGLVHVLVVVGGCASDSTNATLTVAAPCPVIGGTVGDPVPDGPLTIIGSGFGAVQGGSVVMVGNDVAVVNSWSPTSISIQIPGGAFGSPAVQVVVNGCASNAVTITFVVVPTKVDRSGPVLQSQGDN